MADMDFSLNQNIPYNGHWTNQETFLVFTWLTDLYNDTSIKSKQIRDLVNALQRLIELDRGQQNTLSETAYAERVKSIVENHFPVSSGLYADLLQCSVNRVDWAYLSEKVRETF